MDIRGILRNPLVYQTFQETGGFFGARLKVIRAYLPIRPGDKVVDIGCGPGFIANWLPPGVCYWGFDTDEKYIAYARRKFRNKGNFVCGRFDEKVAREYKPIDVVMMNGFLHHLSDDEAHRILDASKQALATGGRLFSLDGCFVDGQPALARFLLKCDRGKYVRTGEHYQSLMASHFDTVEIHLENALSWVPYTWLVMVGRK